jgi:D-inositol-3-phosphate glycosyltransferase
VDDVAFRLAASHLLLLPSASEASPLVLLEAMAAGCPVLAHDVGGVSELTRAGVCGRLVPTLDPLDWTRAARDLLLDAHARGTLVASGRSASAERTVARTASLVESELLRVAGHA